MSKSTENTEIMTLPVIALRGMVAFPLVQVTIEISRVFSLKAFGEAAYTNSQVLLLTQKDFAVDEPQEGDLYRVGTVAAIKHVVKNAEGNLSVVFEGLSRAKVSALERADGYFKAQLVSKAVPVNPALPDRAKELRANVLEVLERLRQIYPPFSESMKAAAEVITDPGVFADFVASGALADFRAKQAILNAANPLVRLEKLVNSLQEQIGLLELEQDLNRKVRSKIDESQRDYFLREQMRVISQELGEDPDEIEEYSQKIAARQLPREVAAKLQKELGRLAKTPFGSAESTVLRNYLEVCLEIPWGKAAKESADVKRARAVLDADHSGLQKVKDRILEYISVKQLAPEVKHQIICLVGPPGTGKTSVAASIARALHRKYVRISLGGVRDEADIRGHRKTYVGAMPGRVVEALTSAGVMNPLLVLDEIDKLTRHQHGDPASALLEVLDPEQNKFFRDHFVELPLDLSDCLFIATANSTDGIPEPLLDRMEVIELPSYSEVEKHAIAQEHLIPKQLKRHGLTRRVLKITDDAIDEIIRGYTEEAGVRNAERELASLCRKVARKIAEGEYKRVVITAADIPAYLGKRKVLDQPPEPKDTVGVVNGLAYTQFGGDLLQVEALLVDGNGKIELTGSLGEVMKESAKIAHTYVRSIADEHLIDPALFTGKDIHVHFPEGAVPKDGPSAGVAMTVAMLSAYSQKPVRHDVAMTGEMTLRGRVLPIGGLREKTFAARRANMTTVLLPTANKRDLDEIDREVKDRLSFVFCETFDDVAKVVFTHDKAAKEASTLSLPPMAAIKSTISAQPGQP
ncbi:MAG: endopeptidase La [Eubacteriales bacterium]